MGNCVNKVCGKEQRERRRSQGERVAPEERSDPEEEGSLQVKRADRVMQEEEKEDAPAEKTTGVKVKVVLTRAELQWLMAQLHSGEQRLEDVLHQMDAARADDKQPQPQPQRDGWRPRLERILECPEAA